MWVKISLCSQITWWYSAAYHNEYKGRAEFALSTLQADQAGNAASPFCPLLTSPPDKTSVHSLESPLQVGT